MKIDLKRENDVLTISLGGRLDTSTAPELDAELNGALEGVKTLYFDFKDLDYLSSAGLRILLITHKTMSKQGKMILRNVNDLIMETFDMTGFSSILTIEEA